jgi:hypothetical protein
LLQLFSVVKIQQQTGFNKSDGVAEDKIFLGKESINLTSNPGWDPAKSQMRQGQHANSLQPHGRVRSYQPFRHQQSNFKTRTAVMFQSAGTLEAHKALQVV